ncbi:MAG: acetyl-CoA hydrolase/transferase C-terminal domain-containing protein [Bacteroidota bacterium]
MINYSKKVIQFVSAEEAVLLIKSNDRVFMQGSAATPITLLNKLLCRYKELQNVELVGISTYGNIEFGKPEYKGSFYINSLFVSDNTRFAINNSQGEYVPVFMSEISRLFKENYLPIDVAIIHVSPPDSHGFCSLGTSVDIARAATEVAKKVIAQVNPNMPRVHGSGFIHISNIDAMVWVEDPLPEVDYSKSSNPVAEQIGKRVAELIEDGATLQLGIGTIPDLVLKNLTGHKNLGIHSEMFSDGVIPLVESGVINNSMKKLHHGKLITGFLVGTRKLYDFVNDNPMVNALDISYVNDVSIIRQNPKATSINSAIEIDLTGQVCADSIGTYQYSGIGGQMDFIRGAALSERGKPIIALPSSTKNGEPRIVANLKPGAGVVTTRGHIHWVVTEYGAVNLFGRNIEQRAFELIKLAHPDHREELEKAYHQRFKR